MTISVMLTHWSYPANPEKRLSDVERPHSISPLPGHFADQTACLHPRQIALNGGATGSSRRLSPWGRDQSTLFIARWLVDCELQRLVQIWLNKGETHHALKNALRISRQGEIRDRSSRDQDDRLAGLDLLAAIIIQCNTKQLGQIIAKRRNARIYNSEDLLSHVSPLGWAHILITGEYRWPKTTSKIP